jgi:transposase
VGVALHFSTATHHGLESKHNSTRPTRNRASALRAARPHSQTWRRTPARRKKQPGIFAAIERLLEDATAGDPITGLKWTRKTLAALTSKLQKKFQVGHTTVARLLKQQGYTLHGNRKRLSPRHDAQRDQQFRYIARQGRQFEKADLLRISVDTKKKELIGAFKNPGRTWRRQALDVFETDFPLDAEGKAIPYGVYDLGRHEGYVVVGTSHETSAFAVAAIRSWWRQVGQYHHRRKNALLIQADGGGANGNRCWLWKFGLQQLSDEFNLTITVTHYPTGASKWNPIEHRLFCRISSNWAGQPLISYETVLKFIRTTKTETGLCCRAHLDTTEYATGLKITREQKEQINLQPHRFLPKYNYTIRPHNSK